MNGESIVEVLSYYKVDPATELIVIYDDISLEPGRLRIRKKREVQVGIMESKDVCPYRGTGILRVKVGVGEKPSGCRIWQDHVLGRMNKKEREDAEESFQEAVSAVELLVTGQTDKAMNDYNAKK